MTRRISQSALCAVFVIAAAGGAAKAQPQPGTRLPPITFEATPGYKVGHLPNGLPDWSGVWGSIGPRNIDSTTDTGTPQPNAPLNAEYAKRYQARLDGFASGKPVTDIGCLPEGAPRIMRAPYSMEVTGTPKQVWLIMEFKNETRRVYTDGRKPMDPDPSYEGYSTGHWEGDTLVFDTVALKAGTLDHAASNTATP